jgi:hypothetical protein
MAGQRDEADVAAGGYESVAIALASALSGGPAARLILNVRNGGTVPALRPDLVIEVPCRVDGGGPVPLPAPAPTPHQLGLMSVVRASERDIADAALLASGRPAGLGDPGADAAAGDVVAVGARERADELALRAFVSHPLVGSLDAARALAAAALPTSSRPTASHYTKLSYRYSSFLGLSLVARCKIAEGPALGAVGQGPRRGDRPAGAVQSSDRCCLAPAPGMIVQVLALTEGGHPRIERTPMPSNREIVAGAYDDGEQGTVVVVWDGRGTTTAGTAYENTYAWIMKLSDGKVVDGTAFYDSIAFNELWELPLARRLRG